MLARRLGLFAALTLAVLLVYQPAWHGAPLWDDDGHLTRPELRSTEGLARIWTDVRATQQYYPLVHSAFWVMHRLWGDATTGYHIVNILLHAFSAFLLAAVMRRLQIPGAIFGAFLFALHPVQVETVAWMTELKNTLSMPFYLGAALMYLKFDESRRVRDWGLALSLFVLALLSKTVTATLPISLLIVMWWRRGKLTIADVRPVLPFFVLGIAGGVLTSWVEHTLIGAKGAEFDLTIIERVLVAGRAFVFYASSLVWPAGLVFQYERWDVSQAVWWQYLFPLVVATVVLVLWHRRSFNRGPLAAMLLYGAALGPALGFVNVYPFRYSFVADHFQYTASAAGLGFIATVLTSFARTRLPALNARLAAGAVVLAPLALLSWQLSHHYTDSETLYRATLERNPRAWMAHNNLALLLMNRTPADLPGALSHVEKSVAIQPNVEALTTRGFIRQQQGDRASARRDYESAIRLNPGFASAHNNLGALNYLERRLDEALVNFSEANRLDPADPEARRNLGLTLMDLGRAQEAEPYLQGAYAARPDNPDVLASLAAVAMRQGRPAEAIVFLERAIQLNPASASARVNLGLAFEQLRRVPEAEARYREALQLEPGSILAQEHLGLVLLRQAKFADALASFSAIIAVRPDSAIALAGRAAALEGLGRLDESIYAYRQALLAPENAASANVHNDFGVALAQRGRRAEAIAEFEAALRLNPSHPDARANLARARGK